MDAWRQKYGAKPRVHGIHCKVRPDDAREFRRWMKVNCPNATITRQVHLNQRGAKRWQTSSYWVIVPLGVEADRFTLQYL